MELANCYLIIVSRMMAVNLQSLPATNPTPLDISLVIVPSEPAKEIAKCVQTLEYFVNKGYNNLHLLEPDGDIHNLNNDRNAHNSKQTETVLEGNRIPDATNHIGDVMFNLGQATGFHLDRFKQYFPSLKIFVLYAISKCLFSDSHIT
uniref:AlNc14C218G9049 protein n=1 Tax=Albugo laibachii Nc14 TaxID=890382 RepID=F0WRQ3_9STRA|nr:AlNc14C218G9049 [Albugo laibachii Nc14]|eukprot:CCA24018.1 AlNc14C218G9049 [Albugo laibachii Nc14]